MEAKSLLVLLVRREMQTYGLRLSRRFRDVVERDDVLSAVDFALLRAVERFDASRGSFLVFAMIWVRREVLHLVRRELEWRKRRLNDHLLADPAEPESPHDEAERTQITRILREERHEIWSAHVGNGASVRDLAATYGKSLRQVQADIARSQRRLSKLHAAGDRTTRMTPTRAVWARTRH